MQGPHWNKEILRQDMLQKKQIMQCLNLTAVRDEHLSRNCLSKIIQGPLSNKCPNSFYFVCVCLSESVRVCMHQCAFHQDWLKITKKKSFIIKVLYQECHIKNLLTAMYPTGHHHQTAFSGINTTEIWYTEDFGNVYNSWYRKSFQVLIVMIW